MGFFLTSAHISDTELTLQGPDDDLRFPLLTVQILFLEGGFLFVHEIKFNCFVLYRSSPLT